MKKTIIIYILLAFTGLYANTFQTAPSSNRYMQRTYQQAVMKQQQKLRQRFTWHHKSAVKGSVASQYQLALMFHYGVGVRQNAELARIWLKRASKRGHHNAQSILYRFYAGKEPAFLKQQHHYYSMNFRR